MTGIDTSQVWSAIKGMPCYPSRCHSPIFFGLSSTFLRLPLRIISDWMSIAVFPRSKSKCVHHGVSCLMLAAFAQHSRKQSSSTRFRLDSCILIA